MDFQDQRGVRGRSRARNRGGWSGWSCRLRAAARRSPRELRDAKAAADLEQLAAGDHDLAALPRGRSARGSGRGRGVVVDDGRGLGAEESREAVFEIRRAAAAGAVGEIVFERVVAGADRRECPDAVASAVPGRDSYGQVIPVALITGVSAMRAALQAERMPARYVCAGDALL